MRARRPIGVLLVLLIIGLLQASLVLATHAPQVSDVVGVATNSTYNMSCKTSASQVDCSAADFDFTWTEYATITPGSGDLVSLKTTAAVAPFWAAPLDSAFRTWMTDLQAVPCNGISRALTAFVASVGNLTADGTVTPLTITSECNLTGGLNVKRDVTGAPTEYDYWINSSVIVPPTPTPSATPTPPPTASPTPTAAPTATPGSTATPRPTPTPTATATATARATPATSESSSGSASASASESPSTSETETASASTTPEQAVAGIAFTPEPTLPAVPAGAPDAGVGGWPGTVPSAGRVSTNLADIGGSALAALLLLVVMGFIGELFNNTTETNYDRIIGWWKKSWVGRIGRGLAGLFGGGST